MKVFSSARNLICKSEQRTLRRLQTLGLRSKHLGALLVIAIFTVNLGAAAETAKSDVMVALASAEEAYQRVDFETVYLEAVRGLEMGGANVKTTARLHSLIGISAAALGKDEDARSHFVASLALIPGLNLERGLSPRIRGPYMEAKGFWEAYPVRIELESSFDYAKSLLSISVEDPARIVSKIRLHIRKIGNADYEKETEAVTDSTFVLPPEFKETGFEFFSYALDRFGNVIYEEGTATAPKRVEPAVLPVRRALDTRETPPKSELGEKRMRRNWWPGILSATGLVSLGVGAVFNYRRETLATDWNSSKCEKPGLTRLSQCGEINSERKVAERVAIGFYSGGGLLLASGIFMWLTDGEEHVNKAKAQSSRQLVDCQWQLGDVLGVSCLGKF